MKQDIAAENAGKGNCNDKNCPFHGKVKCRGRRFTGTIVSAKMHKTVVLEWYWKKYIPKYERYESKRTKIKAHNPSCINAHEGDIVEISECRPLSKTKNFVVVKVIGKEKGFKEKIEAREEAKVKKPVKEEAKEVINKEAKEN